MFVSESQEYIQKQYFTIGEVSKELDLSTSLIRFWETEFREINPKKNRSGNRVYTEKDIEMLRKIHFLLKVKKFTIKGAKERLKQEQENLAKEVQLRDTLIKLRTFLLELKESL